MSIKQFQNIKQMTDHVQVSLLCLLGTPQIIIGPSLPLSPFVSLCVSQQHSEAYLETHWPGWPGDQIGDLYSPICSQLQIPRYHLQPYSKPLVGTCPPSLTLFLEDSIELHGKPNFPPFCRPSQHPLLDQLHSFVSAPNT